MCWQMSQRWKGTVMAEQCCICLHIVPGAMQDDPLSLLQERLHNFFRCHILSATAQDQVTLTYGTLSPSQMRRLLYIVPTTCYVLVFCIKLHLMLHICRYQCLLQLVVHSTGDSSLVLSHEWYFLHHTDLESCGQFVFDKYLFTLQPP